MDAPVQQPNSPEYVHRDEREWETIRWPGQIGKMLFHPHPERPTEPNAGIVRYEAGSHHPLHHYDFAQVWYVLEGQFTLCCSCSIRGRRPAAGRSTMAAST
jgi:quercetin dioxygenase-like cupin family protein